MAKGKLSEYSAKRSFDATPEPGPVPVEGRRGPLLFVIQQHAATRLHYDFRIECDGVLMSWAVPKGLSLDPAEKRLAVRTENHPFEYGSFEGIIPAGQYGAGEVIVWDCGLYSPDEEGTFFHDRDEAQRQVRAGMALGKLSLLLRGEKVKGSFALVRTKDTKSWLLIKHKDRFVSKADLTAANRSVLSGVTVEEILSAPVRCIPAGRLVPGGASRLPPRQLSPMQAELGDKAFNHADWAWEPKLDGYRALAFIDSHGVQLRSRKGLDLAADFPRLVEELRGQAVRQMILDGEIVAFDAAGKPSFGAIQNRASRGASRAVFYGFDLLWFEGIDLRALPYADRRRYLAQCVLPSPGVQLVHSQADGIALYAAALASGLEGVVGKKKSGRYEAGRRSAAWTKVKAMKSAEFVIGGYTRGKGSRQTLGALLLGAWEDGRLRYISHVGAGFDDATLDDLRGKLVPLERNASPFAEKPETNAPATWVEPKLVAEVRFQSWTEAGHLRAPVFLRLRDDVRAQETRIPRPERTGPRPAGVVGEVLAQLDVPGSSLSLNVGGHRIRVTHLDRVYWPADEALMQPALTKRDLLRYFAGMSPCLLTHLRDRPLTMIRMPEGIAGERFFQKHWHQELPPYVETLQVFSSRKDESRQVLLCNNLPTLLWLAQSGTLELHVWHSRACTGADAASDSMDFDSSLASLEASVLNFPDYVVFDIDPYIYSGKEKAGEEPELNTAAFEKGKEVAFRLRELLREMGLDGIVKTSGKTGLHVFVPIRRAIDFDAARTVSELIGRHLMRRHPKDITLEWSVPKRAGKIFMDYSMNVRGKTLNAAYSPRGVAGAPVSMPLTWEELARAHPLDFRLANALERVARTGDRWRDALGHKVDLNRALKGTGA